MVIRSRAGFFYLAGRWFFEHFWKYSPQGGDDLVEVFWSCYVPPFIGSLPVVVEGVETFVLDVYREDGAHAPDIAVRHMQTCYFVAEEGSRRVSQPE